MTDEATALADTVVIPALKLVLLPVAQLGESSKALRMPKQFRDRP